MDVPCLSGSISRCWCDLVRIASLFLPPQINAASLPVYSRKVKAKSVQPQVPEPQLVDFNTDLINTEPVCKKLRQKSCCLPKSCASPGYRHVGETILNLSSSNKTSGLFLVEPALYDFVNNIKSSIPPQPGSSGGRMQTQEWIQALLVQLGHSWSQTLPKVIEELS